VTSWGLRLAAAALILITGYYLFVIFMFSDQLFRGLSAPGQQMSAQDFQRHVGNLEFLTRIMLVATVVLLLTTMARFYMMPEAGAVLLVIGTAFFFGIPFLIDSFGGADEKLPRALARVAVHGAPRLFLKNQYVLAGMMLMGVGAFQLLVHGVLLLIHARSRRPKANDEAAKTAASVRKAQDKFLGPCWTLPFCRDTDKKLCPIRHSKRPCWRTGRGCYCDQNIILTLSGGNTYSASRGTAGYLSRTATVARPKTYREKREQCLSCPVYLHHQSQKYRLLAPGTLVGAVVLFIFYREQIINAFPNGMLALGKAMSGLTFGTTPGQVPQWAVDLGSNPILSWMIVIVGGLLLVAYLLHTVEWALYRLGV
jgi:hypothetical protein